MVNVENSRIRLANFDLATRSCIPFYDKGLSLTGLIREDISANDCYTRFNHCAV
jgi:hypothetical protein